jgi:hypothetical protein
MAQAELRRIRAGNARQLVDERSSAKTLACA